MMLSPPYNTVDRDDVGRGNDLFCDAPSTRTRYLEEHGPSIYNCKVRTDVSVYPNPTTEFRKAITENEHK